MNQQTLPVKLDPPNPPDAPAIRITSRPVREAMLRYEGVMQALRKIDEVKEKLRMPGLSLASATVAAEAAKLHMSFFANLTRVAAKAGMDFSAWVISGVTYDENDDPYLLLESMDKVDRDVPI